MPAAFKDTIQVLKRAPIRAVLLMGLLPAAGTLLQPFLASNLEMSEWPRSALFMSVYGSIEHSLILVGLAGIAPALLRGDQPGIYTFARSLRYLPQLLLYVSSILMVCGFIGVVLSVAVFAGMGKIGLIIVGVVLALCAAFGFVRIAFVPYLIVDMGLTLPVAFARSWHCTRKRLGYLLCTIGALAVLGGLPTGLFLVSSSVAKMAAAALTMLWWSVAGLTFASIYLSCTEEA